MGASPGTLVEALSASARGDRGVFLSNGSGEDRFMSYAELQEAARALLGQLRRAGAERGMEVVFQIDDHFAFLRLFWACQMGGMVPVPVAAGRNQEQRLKVFRVCAMLRRPFLVFDDDALRARLEEAAARQDEGAAVREILAKATSFSALAAHADGAERVEIVAASPGDVAHIQFSSGSTGAPKGVVLTHENVLTNARDMAEVLGLTELDTLLSWKPLTHDFGIFGFHILPIVAGVSQCWIPTSVFMRKPTLWMERANHYRASVLGTPNSGCRTFLQLYRREEAARWDLSCVRVIMNGAEPISAEICRAFLRELAPYGLAPTAMVAGYGLAEATLAVSLRRPASALATLTVDRRSLRVGEPLRPAEASAPEAMEMVNLGQVMRHTEVRIVAGDGRDLPDDSVGHVHIRGSNVTAGYYGTPEAERRSSAAWFDTGDVGFTRNGDVFLTGRVKNIIIIGGINYYAHDIERVAESHARLRETQTVACGVPGPSGSEDVVLFVRYKGRLEELVQIKQAVTEHIGRQMGIFPVRVIPVKQLPRTTSGKLQRHMLQQPYLEGTFDSVIREIERIEEAPRALAPIGIKASPRQAMIEQVAAEASRLVEQPIADADRSLSDCGFDSARAVELARRLGALFGVDLPASLAYDHPTIAHIADHLLGRLGRADGAPREAKAAPERDEREPIAVIGLGCRFPGGASDPRAFFELLDRGGDAVSEVPPSRWSTAGWWAAFPGRPGASYSRHGAFLDRIDEFDSDFFGITPVEADALDPQQRLLLEVCHEVLEHAGIDPGSLRSRRVGVFVGTSDSGYARVAAAAAPSGYGLTGTMASMAAGRVAYVLGLRGPALAVDTACSSSLVGVHLAVQSLRRGESDAALAGGVSLMVDGDGHVALSALRALSPEGRCSTFDDAADGYVRGEGCGVVLLKRLSDALADGDRVLALIRGTALNHDGHSNGLTAPNGVAQEEVIRSALADARLDPSAIDYVEAHGTGTRLGDPQEIGALDRVFGRERRERLLVGSVKTNIGHLEAAAGIAGLIKVVLALDGERIPRHLHFRTPNAHVPWSQIAIRVAAEPAPWPRGPRPRAAGVSAFGLSGTNAHVILAEAPLVRSEARPAPPHHLLCISARSEPSLRALAARYLNLLARSAPAPAPADICHTAAIGRSRYPHRLAVSGASGAALAAGISTYLAGQPSAAAFAGEAPRGEPRVAFLFTGQGSQHAGMGRSLYETHPEFRGWLDECDALFRAHLGLSVVASMYGAGASDDTLRDTLRAQPAIFSLGYALARLWRSWGIRPAAVLGHSVGELVAACDAGVLSLEAAAAVVAARARLMDELPSGGAMASVLASEEEVRAIVADTGADLGISAFNGPRNFTLSGSAAAIDAALAAFARAGRPAQRLAVSHAFHSPRMDPILDRLQQAVAGVSLRAPQVPLISNVTASPLSAAEATDPGYWARHSRAPVRFAASIRRLYEEKIRGFIEIGAQPTLLGMARQCLPEAADTVFLPSLKRGSPDWEPILASAGRAYVHGIDVDLGAIDRPFGSRKVDLPTYPFERSRRWVEVATAPEALEAPKAPEVGGPEQAPPSPPHRGKPDRAQQAEALASLLEDLEAISGLRGADFPVDTPLVEIGLDSLMLIQLNARLKRRFGVEYGVEAFFRDAISARRIAQDLAARRSATPQPPAPAPLSEAVSTGEQPAPAAAPGRDPAHAVESGLTALFSQQIAALSQQTSALAQQSSALERVIAQQLSMLQGRPAALGAPAEPATQAAALARPAPQGLDRAPPAHGAPDRGPIPRPGPADYSFINLSPDEHLTEAQRSFIATLIERRIARTASSKAFAEQHRARLSDWINVLSFRRTLKELSYPLVAARSEGSRFWDIDGNELVDIAIGYGVGFFGHRPPFVMRALEDQMRRGLELGPQSALVGEVADLVCELTGMDRVTFCNTGSEAVMVALRLARAVTGRSKIARFTGAYHGTFDGVLAVADDSGTTRPMAHGTPPSMVEDAIVLNYDTPQALQTLRERGHELAAVLVEPVQSRRPDLQPREFLHELRRVASERGVALIFDEVITGFRVHPGGAQAHFGVEADIAIYGKVIGGGMPIGLVASRGRFLDALDGGPWRFGDDSYPSQRTTVFGGTFCKHPLAMAAAKAVLLHLKERGPALQLAVSGRTARLAAACNAHFERRGVPVRVNHFASQFRFDSYGKYSPLRQPIEMDLFFQLLMDRGVYTWERRICFLSTAHSDEDVDLIITAVKGAVDDLLDAGFFADVVTPTPPTPGGGGLFNGARAPTSGHGEPLPEAPQALPMASAQRRMFALSQSPASELALHLSGAWQIEGPVDAVRLERAFQEVVARHDSLRTGLELRGDDFVQVIHSRCAAALDVIDVPPGELDAAVQSRVAPFDLARPPLARLSLVRSEGRSVLVFDAHHAAMDGPSLDVFFRELTAALQGERLPQPAAQYRDYVAWLDGRAQELDAMAAFWLEHLSAPLPSLELPTDFPRPPVLGHEGRTITHRIPVAGIQALARARRASPFMVLLAAYYAWIYRLTGQEDVVVGTVTTTRDEALHRDLVGMTANTAALRARPSGAQPFRELLDAVQRACLAAYPHADYPFDRLVERLGVTRDASRHPVFGTLFSYEKPRGRVVQIDGVRAARFEVEKRAVQCDLDLDIVEQDGELEMSFTFATSLFRPETMQRLSLSYARLLNAAAAHPDKRLSELPLLTEAEEALLAAWNDTAAEYPSDTCIHELFEAQAEKTPEAVAVEYEERQLTYRELNRRSNQLAHHLRTLGVGPEVLVGLCVERSLEMVVGLLGILKAGGAYVPLDPSYPEERLAFMVADARLPVLLTQARLEGRLPAHEARVVRLDTEASQWEAQPDTTPASGVGPDHAMYAVYTSGSTGRPKGVVNAHRGPINHMAWLVRDLRLDARDRVIQKSSINFDASVLEFWAPWWVGGCLVLAPADAHTNPQMLGEVIRRRRVTVVQGVPTLLEAMLNAGAFDGQDSLRRVVSAGEALTGDVYRSVTQAAGCELFNLYGPTEAAIDVTLRSPGECSSAVVPIGSPRPNVACYVLDAALNQVPVGLTGELYLAGLQLARGYLNRPGLTAERFLPDPIAGVPGARMYRTGDLARWRGDGELEYLGRVDHQVKIRGFRIELGEIEAALALHASVRACVVVVREDNPGDKRLAAYVVADGSEWAPSGLREHLRARLPEYMVPSAFVRLGELPVSPNGKLDRKALPALEGARELEQGYVAPRTPMERALAAIWEDVLRTSPVGVHDNFFEAGGHSLNAVRASARAASVLGRTVELADFYRAPTIHALAALLEEKGAGAAPPIPRAPEQPLYDLSSAQRRLWLIDRMAGGLATYNMVGSFDIRGPLDADALEAAFADLIARHEILRTSFVTAGGVPKQRVHTSVPFQLERIHLDGVQDADATAKLVVQQEATRPFDLAAPPLLRASLLCIHALPPIRHVLVLNFHHILSDGWSTDVVFRDLGALYRRRTRHGAPGEALPPLRIQHRDYASWQAARLAGGDLEPDRRYWALQLGDLPPPLALPADYPQARRAALAGSFVAQALAPALVEQLRGYARGRRASLFTVLLAALKVLLYRYSAQPDIVVGTPVAGRDHPDLEHQIGCFLNMLPLRDSIDPERPFRDLVEQVRATAQAAFEHAAYPFDRMVDDAKQTTAGARHPIFNVMLIVNAEERRAPELAGVEVTEHLDWSSGSKLDLSFEFRDRGDLTLYLEYDASLFSPEAAQAIAAQMEAVIGAVTGDDHQDIRDVSARARGAEHLAEEQAMMRTIMQVDDSF